MALCRYCLEAIDRELPNRDVDETGSRIFIDLRRHHSTSESLTECAKSCKLCAAFLQGISGFLNNSATDKQGASFSFVTNSYTNRTGSRLELLKHGIVAKSFERPPVGSVSLLIKRDNLRVKCSRICNWAFSNLTPN